MDTTQELEVRTPAGFTRRFAVTPMDDQRPPRGYILHGARGATYGALRFRTDPYRLHIMGLGATGNPFPGVVLNDADGTLRQERTR